MKILNRLTLKNLRLNKSRTVVTIIGIILSTALITVVAGMATSAKQTLIEGETVYSGDYDMRISGFEQSDIDSIESNRDVGSVYITERVGCAYLPESKNEKRPYINITAYSKDALSKCFKASLQEGRYPENDSELVLSQDLINNSQKSFKVGDKITLEVGSRYDRYGNLLPDTLPTGMSLGESGEEYIEDEGPETLKVSMTKEYTIVGILDEVYNSSVTADKYYGSCTAITFTDGSNISQSAVMYIQFLPESEKDYLRVAAGITGLDEDEVLTYLTHDEGTFDELSKKSKFSDFDVNTYLLRLKGYGNSDETMTMLYSLAGIIIAIIIIASVFVIRNSFAISITEKTKLYGMIASIGATSKQIRKNVLFEGFILAVIGIPLGLLLGIGVAALLIVILNVLMKEMLNGVSVVYSIPAAAVIFAVALSAVTILCSTASSAVRASRISPITAIRSNTDIKISKKNKKAKKYKSPKFVKRLFGVGGDIAYKNLQRSRKKYRTTVISITVSVALFIAMSSFVHYGFAYSSEYYSEMEYNFYVFSGSETESIDSIRAFDGVNKSVLTAWGYADFKINLDDLSEKSRESVGTPDNENFFIYLDICAFDDDFYKQTVKTLGYDYDEVKDKGIINNRYVYAEDGKKYYDEKYFIREDGYTLSGKSGESGEINLEVEIAGSFYEMPKELEDLGVATGTIIVSKAWFEENVPEDASTYSLSIQTDDADKLEEEIENQGYTDVNIGNYDATARALNSMVLIIEIFIYGFIIVITLIGVTNIFNTITTNMKLRSKEFATLKSIGMTKKEFNRMIRLESLFYGAKSLIIGIPLGVLGSFGIYWAFTNRVDYGFTVPWQAILISIVFVFVVVWLIMKFSVGKVNRQNIIETIRNDNI